MRPVSTATRPLVKAVTTLLLVTTSLVLALAPGLPAVAATRTVESGNFYFSDATTGSQDQIRVAVGDQLVVNVIEGRRHTVNIDELGISSGEMEVGQSYTTPPLDRAGSYVLYCKTHLNRGHRITLVVGTGAAPPPPPPPASPSPAPEPSPTPTTAPPTPSPTPTAASPSPTTTASTSATPSQGSTSPPSPTPSTTTSAAPTTTPSLAASAAPSQDSGTTAVPVAPTGGAPPVGAPLDGDQTPGDTTSPQAADEVAPVGLTGSGTSSWTRAFTFALAAALPMAAAAGWALRRSTRR